MRGPLRLYGDEVTHLKKISDVNWHAHGQTAARVRDTGDELPATAHCRVVFTPSLHLDRLTRSRPTVFTEDFDRQGIVLAEKSRRGRATGEYGQSDERSADGTEPERSVHRFYGCASSGAGLSVSIIVDAGDFFAHPIVHENNLPAQPGPVLPRAFSIPGVGPP